MNASTPIAQAVNSTNVRTSPWLMRALSFGLRAAEDASPALAARLGETLMFRTTRRALREDESALLARAHAFEVFSPTAGTIAAWSWGEGPVVVLVHGWNGRGAQLGTFVEPLVSRGFQVVTFDAPGHGRSPGSRSSMIAFADALDAVLDAVRPLIGNVHAIVSHSMGGPATTYAMHRRRVAPGAGLERALGDDGLPSERFVFIAPPTDLREFVATFAARTGLGARTEAELQRVIERRFGLRLADLRAPLLARGLHAPLLVIHDENDREVPLARGRELSAAWPGARFEATQGFGHVRILRAPSVIGRVVDFVSETALRGVAA